MITTWLLNYLLKKKEKNKETQIKTNGSVIYRALLKNGYSNFSLEILEYCSPENTILREQYYIDLLKPEYNILKTAGSLLGFKHSEETIKKFRIQSPFFFFFFFFQQIIYKYK